MTESDDAVRYVGLNHRYELLLAGNRELRETIVRMEAENKQLRRELSELMFGRRSEPFVPSPQDPSLAYPLVRQ